MYKNFLNILNKHGKIKENVLGNEDIGSVPYNIMKSKSKRYLQEWSVVKRTIFKNWTVKPDIWNFCIKSE